MDLNYIIASRLGHVDMLHAIFGKPDDDDKVSEQTKALRQKQREFHGSPPENAPPITPEAFDSMFMDPDKRNTKKPS